MGLLDDLRNATDEHEQVGDSAYAQSWRWEKKGDGIEGVVVAVTKRVHDNHPEGYPIVTIRDADGQDIAVHGLTYVLKDEISKRNLRPGDLFAVIYDGKKDSANGRSFHAFRVASKQGDGVVPQNRSIAQAVEQPPF